MNTDEISLGMILDECPPYIEFFDDDTVPLVWDSEGNFIGHLVLEEMRAYKYSQSTFPS